MTPCRRCKRRPRQRYLYCVPCHDEALKKRNAVARAVYDEYQRQLAAGADVTTAKVRAAMSTVPYARYR